MKNILFIDDDLRSLSSLKRLLRKQTDQWGLHFVNSVDKGLKYIQKQDIDLVICDILMPEKNGFDMLKIIKSSDRTKYIPVVMLTGMIDPKLKLKALNMGATDLLNKPVDRAELIARISNCLRIKDYHDRIIDQNQFLEGEIQERIRHSVMAAEVGSILVKGRDLKEMAGGCCRAIVRNLDAAFARIWILSEGKNQLELIASEGIYTHLDGNHQFIPMGALKIGKIAGNREAHLTNSVIGDPNINDQEWAKREKMIAFAGQPLIVGGRLVGVAAMFSRQRLENSALDALASISDEIALGLDRKQTEEKAWFYAHHDALTGLPNRQLFLKNLESAIEYSGRYEKKFAVILIDLDNFSRINKSLGYTAGDDCLKTISNRVRGCLRSSDQLSRLTSKEAPLARMGGDQFVILLQNTNDIYGIGQVCRRLLDEFIHPVFVGSREIFISASIGTTVFPEDGTEAETLLKNTEITLFYAKAKGKNTFAFYSDSMDQVSIKLLEMENNLRTAAAKNQFKLYFQPKIRLEDKRIIGAEALIRWEIKNGQFIPPSDFIPLAEKSGQIISIGDWVLETACRTIRDWCQAGLADMHIAVNFSAQQLDQDDLTDKISAALEKWMIKPEWIEVEITETLVMANPEKAIQNLEQLKQMGLSIALDDFGTGYSSLAYLQKLPIDYIKIDISFIKRILTNPYDAVMVKTIIDMAHNLGLEVVAEGVEEQEQMERLEQFRCDIVQGYLMGRPMPEHEFIQLFDPKEN